jgi:putative ABC transport system permease protein
LSREYGKAMEEMLDGRLAETRDLTGRQRVRFWWRELASLGGLAWSERFGEGPSGRRRRQREYNRFKAGPLDTLGQELHQAARRLLRSPAFTTASVLTLALALGANAAIFAVVERVVINPLPYPQSDRLINVDHGSVAFRVNAGMSMAPGMYFIYRNRAQSLESIAAFNTSDRTLAGRGEPERLRVAKTTPSLTTVLRVTPALGRWFTEDEGLPGGRAVAVLSHALWQRKYDGRGDIIGQPILIDDRSVEVVGVMPQDFAFPSAEVAAWVPEPLSVSQGFGLFTLQGVGRLRDGVSFETARVELQGLLGGIDYINTGLSFVGRPLKDTVLGDIARTLWMLLAAVGAVLLVAGANIANLFLVRAELRQREVAIRHALGGARGALARFFLAESALLSLAGGAVGLAVAWGALEILVNLGPPSLPRLHEVRLDVVAIAYVVALTLISAVIFGLLPIWRSSHNGALYECGRANTATRQRHRTRHLLLGAEVAMTLVLLVVSSLMVRSVWNLRAVDPGFNPDSMLTFTIGLSDRQYPSIDDALSVHHRVIDRLAAIPGVQSVSGSTCLPLSGGCEANTIRVEGEVIPPGALPPLVMFRAVTGGYMETMGMRILRGRAIDRGDVERKEPVVVVSESLARRAFGASDPIGRRVASNQPPPRPGLPPIRRWWTVVGVVADTPMRALNEPIPPSLLFMPLSLARGAATPIAAQIGPTAGVLSYVVRTASAPLDLMPSVRNAVRSIDNQLPIARVTTLQGLVDAASAQMSFTMALLSIAAAIGLILGVIGIYGVTSYIISQRTSEIGVRLALGAVPGSITSQIVKQGGLVALAGIIVGLVAALAGSQLVASILYGVNPRDPAVFAAMSVLLLLVALLACWIPARRAARLSPTIALRTE